MSHYLSIYEQQRNELIPFAEAHANAQCPPGENGKWLDEDADDWSRVFHAEMDRLWKERQIAGEG
jgi:hypothetical protein